MIELLVLALLLWLWVIERRLNALRAEMQAMHRDLDLVRNKRFDQRPALKAVDSTGPHPPQDPA